jgi:hypothetical protein
MQRAETTYPLPTLTPLGARRTMSGSTVELAPALWQNTTLTIPVESPHVVLYRVPPLRRQAHFEQADCGGPITHVSQV